MRTAKYVSTVAERSRSECPASDRIASEPVRRPIAPFATVRPAEAAIDPSAAFSLTFIGSPLLGGVNGGKSGRQSACRAGRSFAADTLHRRSKITGKITGRITGMYVLTS